MTFSDIIWEHTRLFGTLFFRNRRSYQIQIRGVAYVKCT